MGLLMFDIEGTLSIPSAFTVTQAYDGYIYHGFRGGGGLGTPSEYGNCDGGGLLCFSAHNGVEFNAVARGDGISNYRYFAPQRAGEGWGF